MIRAPVNGPAGATGTAAGWAGARLIPKGWKALTRGRVVRWGSWC